MTLTSDALAGFAGVVLSLLMSYTPKLKDWYNTVGGKDNETYQRAIMAVLIVLTGVAALGLSCAHIQGLPFTLACTQQSAVALAESVFWALIGSQSTHHLTG